ALFQCLFSFFFFSGHIGERGLYPRIVRVVGLMGFLVLVRVCRHATFGVVSNPTRCRLPARIAHVSLPGRRVNSYGRVLRLMLVVQLVWSTLPVRYSSLLCIVVLCISLFFYYRWINQSLI